MNGMIEELNYIEVRKTWSFFNLPYRKKEIGVKWVYKVNPSPKGELIRHKTQLITKCLFTGKALTFMKFLH